MPSRRRTRADQRAASEAAILDAAVELYAGRGPDGVSLREVARSAGLTHALVARYFGSKQGLVSAVERRLATDVRTTLDRSGLTDTDSFVALLTSVRRSPTLGRLVVRSGLGDLDDSIVPGVIVERCATASGGDRRSRLCVYAAASLLLGWLSWDGFLVPALGLGRVSARRRDQTMATTATALLQLANQPEPGLEPRGLTTIAAEPEQRTDSARDALLTAAVELFAERGPASVSVRDIARHAGVNHGLVHRHFGSKDELLAEAIEVGSFPLLPGAFAPEGFDIDAVVHALHQGSPSPRTIARALGDHIAIATIRRRYPVLRGLTTFAGGLPTEARPAAVADARLASAAAASLVVGSAIWGDSLRHALELDDVESAVGDLGRWLLGAPTATRPTGGDGR